MPLCVPWYAIPSAKAERAKANIEQWKAMGYRTAVLLNANVPGEQIGADLVVHLDPYPGYYSAVNHLCRQIPGDPEIVVTGGDDISPDPKKKATEIAEEFLEHFKGTLGVMQPIGDNWEGTANICGSPWMGRDWIKRSYQGHGPFHRGYFHFYGDEELKRMAERHGMLWQRPDIVQFHRHWSRASVGMPKQDYHAKLDRYWFVDQALFFRRREANFPGNELAALL
jgi:hypothetical protein